MIHVIFICTGNICRSAMAEKYLKHKLKELNLENKVKVTSAGTYAISGEDSTEFAKKAIGKHLGYSYLHQASTLEEGNITEADYILVMTNKHKQDVLSRYPNLEGKVQLLKEYSHKKDYMDIDDPWGFNYNVYEECAEQIVECVDNFVQQKLIRGE